MAEKRHPMDHRGTGRERHEPHHTGREVERREHHRAAHHEERRHEDGREREAVVRHEGMVEHRHHHVHEHVIRNDEVGGSLESDARRGGDGKAGLRAAQDAFARTFAGGPTPSE